MFSTWVNASFVAPGPTYTGEDSTAYFGGWDVTSLMVRNAENVIGIQAYATINRSFVGQLVVQFTDGSRSVVTTSTAWRARAGGDVYPNPASITKAPAYFNAPVENLDMRVYPDGFAAVGSVGTNWLPAVAAPVVPGLKPMAAPAVERQLKTPASVTQLEGAGHFLVDFGRSWVGGIELAVAGTSGQTVDVRMGERLTAAGNAVEYDAPSGVKYRDVWTLRDGQQTVRHWGYRVFRYVELIGLPPSFQPSDVRAAALVYPFDRSSSALLTSNPTLDRVWQFSKDSIESLNVDLYMDSPTRERAPYEADAYDQMLAHHYTEGDLALGKVSLDWLMPKPTWPTEWKAYTIMSAYQYWLASGDTTWLTANYATLQARLMPAQYFNTAGLVEKPATQSLTGDDIVDWPYTNRDSYKFTTINTVVNAFTYRSLMDIAAIALVVGKGDDAAAYTARATTLRTAINTTLFDTTVGKYRDGAVGAAATHYSVHASVFAVALGVAAATEKPAAVSYIAQRGMACSLYCAPFLLQALFENGRAARAIELMTSAAVPGWIAMMDTFGAGATMEAWNPTLKPNTTYSHPAGASPAFVVPRFVFGVRPTGPAYSSFTVEPSPGTLTSGSTKVPTVRGTITVSFGNPGDGNGVTVAVPTTTTATVSLVAATGMALLVDGVSVPATRTPDGSRLSLTVGPGTHVVAVP